MIRSSSSEPSAIDVRPSARPALFTRMSTRPSCCTALSTNARALSSSVTSSGAATCPDPGNSEAARSTRSTRRAPSASRAPSAASARAVVSPIPLEAPVTIAVLPSNAAIAGAYALRRADRRIDEVAEITAVPPLGEPHEIAEEGCVRPLAALVRGDPRKLEQLVHLGARKVVVGGLIAHGPSEPCPRLLQPAVHSRSLEPNAMRRGTTGQGCSMMRPHDVGSS